VLVAPGEGCGNVSGGRAGGQTGRA